MKKGVDNSYLIWFQCHAGFPYLKVKPGCQQTIFVLLKGLPLVPFGKTRFQSCDALHITRPTRAGRLMLR
jgi:hypothetical protein